MRGMPQIVAIEPGKYRDNSGTEREFSAADLQATAEAYDTALHEAPIVVGHPKHDAPAYGWIKGVKFDGQQLTLEADQVNPDFAEMHRSGAFKKHSLALYPPDDPRNPKPGVWYPRHIGFLGATPPAIKGLPQTEFADGDHPVEIEFNEVDGKRLGETLREILRRVRELVLERFGREEADKVLPGWEVDDIERRITKPDPSPQFSEDPAMSEDKTTAEELAAREAKIKADEERLAKDEAKRRRRDAAEFAEELADAGRILPRHQPAVTELLLALPTEEVEFSEGEETRKEAPDKLFREFLESLPKAIEFGEKSGDDLPDARVDFTVPPGCVLDPERTEMLRKVQAYQRKHGCEFSEAVDAVAH